MKNKYFLFVIAIFLSVNVFSQAFDGGISFGIAGTQVRGDNLSGFNKAGIFVGPFISLELSPRSSLQFQLEFAQKGSRQYPDSTNNYESYILRLNYIQLPIKYQFRYSQRFGFSAGLSYGFLIFDQEIVNGYEFDFGQPAFNKSDINAHLGVDWFLTKVLTVRLELSRSLLPVRKLSAVENPTTFFKGGQYNNILLLALQYNISRYKRMVKDLP